MKRYIPLVTVLLGVLLFMQGLQQHESAAALTSSPSLIYLGEGGSYTVDPGQHFIVKRVNPYFFENEPGPSYVAAPGERVWAATVSAPNFIWRAWVNYGYVPANCKITYTTIDDDPDNRINEFYLNDNPIHAMPQGMVSGGQFYTQEAGNLKLMVTDSIGLWIDKCDVTNPPTNTPTPKPPTATPTVPGPTSTQAAPTPTSKAPATATATPTPTKRPRQPACLRINFEVAEDKAKPGLYEVREVGGRLLYSWYAQEGWTDSGWVYGIDISFENVYVEVFFVPEDGPKVKMEIMNPAPGTSYGWLAWGVCHALEVGWPDPSITPTPTPDVNDGFNDEFDKEELDLQRYIWPDIQPTPSSTPAGSLRG